MASAGVWLFHLKHVQGQRGQLCPNVIREICQYIPGPLLVHVRSTFLRVYNFHTSTWGPRVPLSTSILADYGSSWVMLKGRVFCCGGGFGGNLNKAAYMLAGDGAVERKADMKEGRIYHGLLALHSTLLVFGGQHKTCEKFQLLTNTWTDLPPMLESRWSFNPCMLLGVIYLCGEGSCAMEAFALHTNTFLPRIVLPETQACCLYVHNNLLVVNSRNYILKYAVGPDGQLLEKSRVNSPFLNKYQNSQPVVGRGLYFMVQNDECVGVDMHTGVEVSRVA